MYKITLLLIVITLTSCHRNKTLTIEENLSQNPYMINLKHFGVMDCSDDPTTMWQKQVTISKHKFFPQLNYPKGADKKTLFLANEPTLEALASIIEKSLDDIHHDYNIQGITHAFIAEELEGFETADYEFHNMDQQQYAVINCVKLLNTLKLRTEDLFLVDSEKHVVLTYSTPKKRLYLNHPLFVTYNSDYELIGISVDR